MRFYPKQDPDDAHTLTHPAQRKKIAEKLEVIRRNKKAHKYLDSIRKNIYE